MYVNIWTTWFTNKLGDEWLVSRNAIRQLIWWRALQIIALAEKNIIMNKLDQHASGRKGTVCLKWSQNKQIFAYVTWW
jgi:hypothetical protein